MFYRFKKLYYKNFKKLFNKSSTSYHMDWQNARVKFILDRYPKNFFKNKSILELGAFNGYIGSRFGELGAIVTSVEGREENCERIREQPYIKNVICENVDSPNWNFGNYDIIINFGLLYHLENNHEQHIYNCLNNCSILFLESVIYDSFDDELFCNKENGIDQSLSNIGCVPSTLWVENRFKAKNVEYDKITSSKLNGGVPDKDGGIHLYDWEDLNSKKLDRWNRRFWIVNNKTN